MLRILENKVYAALIICMHKKTPIGTLKVTTAII